MGRISVLLAFCLVVSAAAGSPRVVADIAPVHSLAARVMDGVGEPGLLVPSGTTPHGFALRPSDAELLAGAEVVFWIGDVYTPWLGEAIESLAPEAASVPMMESEEGESSAGHGHGHAHGHGHGHGGEDPHIWLDPVEAQEILERMAEALSESDPANAARYAANAVVGRGELDRLAKEIETILAPVRGKRFVLYHDAFGHFEERFRFEAAGAIADGDAALPGPARIAELRKLDPVCVFAEPQHDSRFVEVVAEGSGARMGVLDPLGAALPPGPGLYPALLKGVARGLADCLAGSGSE